MGVKVVLDDSSHLEVLALVSRGGVVLLQAPKGTPSPPVPQACLCALAQQLPLCMHTSTAQKSSMAWSWQPACNPPMCSLQSSHVQTA